MRMGAFPRIAFTVCIVLLAANGWSGSVVDTRHNLSITGPGPVKSDAEEEVCIFCHAPHGARTDVPYLWNRASSVEEYITYTSSTLRAGDLVGGKRRVGQPTGASAMCLSCHDGTIALGAVVSRPEISFPIHYRFMPEDRPGYIGTDLSGDHPVSFVYDDELVAANNGQLVPPSSLAGVTLDAYGMLQCTACHDPHDNDYGKFLVMDNTHGMLCTSCHAPTEWTGSAHESSTATWNRVGDDPWPHTDLDAVDKNACGNCHRPHKADGRERLLNHAIPANNCLVCHNGNVAAKDLASELDKPYAHGVQNYGGVHDPAEDFSAPVERHVECVDCHNPHRVRDEPGTAPGVPGVMRGVRGLDTYYSNVQVDEAPFLYQVCFTCHSNTNQFESGEFSIERQHITHLPGKFDPANPSYHPVVQAGKNPDVPSLIAPLNESSIIYCTDCHANDDPAGPRGPHGSNHRYLLERNYTTDDHTPESVEAYALCYKCHDRETATGATGRFSHKKHVVDNDAPCSACHDPHGSRTNIRLINFDLAIVEPNSNGCLEFNNSETTPKCYLMCHGNDHTAGEGPGC
jgi:predicted CXXCH cytochrome family protein